MTYQEFIQNILDTRGRFACGEEYHERHHIVPKCLGGTNDEDNLIDLFCREHYEAHRLLALENPYNKSLHYAFWCMVNIPGITGKRYRLTAEEYEAVRIKFAEAIRGENNPNYGNSALMGKNNPMFGVDRRGEKSPWYGKHRDEDTIEKFTLANSKTIFQKDDDGDIINVFDSATEASRITGICVTCIKDVARHRGRSIRAGGYRWEYEENYVHGGSNYKKPVLQLDESGNIVSFYDSIAKASEVTGINKSSIANVCKGTQGRKTAGGYKWKFIENEEIYETKGK